MDREVGVRQPRVPTLVTGFYTLAAMAGRLALVFAFALLAFACTGPSGVDTTEGQVSAPPAGTAGKLGATTTDGPESAGTPGKLVILDEMGDIVVIDPDGSNPRALTTDSGDAGYFQPIWSPDSTQVAWGQIAADGFAIGYQTVDDSDPTVVPMSNLPFYFYWAPHGESIAVLHNGVNGLDFEVVDVAAGTSSVLDTGAPYYFSWSPSGDQVVTHVGEDRFETITTDGDRAPLGSTSPAYLAPQWTVNGIVHVDEQHLILETQDGTQSQIADLTGFTMFVANPQATRVALQSLGTDIPGGSVDEVKRPLRTVAFRNIARVPSNQVVVVDVGSGELDVVHPEPAVAFFWSPNGQSLLVFAVAPGADSLTAMVWTAGRGSKELADFVPPVSLLRDLFPFFPQYAQSMSFWSPDSTAFAYPGVVGEERGIWVRGLDQPAAQLVSDGTWVAWSP